MPDTRRLPANEDPRQYEILRDFLHELVELDDEQLAETLRIDVNLWRRQQLVFKTFKLTGSSQVVWNVKKDLKKSLAAMNLELYNEDNLLQEFQCEVHLHQDMKATDFAAHLVKKTDSGQEQIYFEIEVNGEEIVYLENLSSSIRRSKISLQLFGAHHIAMRSRCIRTNSSVEITVANPRIMVLTSPKQ